jgi:hypothetical protein
VCNRQTPKDRSGLRPATTIEIKHGPAVFVNTSFFSPPGVISGSVARLFQFLFQPPLLAPVEDGIDVKGQQNYHADEKHD